MKNEKSALKKDDGHSCPPPSKSHPAKLEATPPVEARQGTNQQVSDSSPPFRRRGGSQSETGWFLAADDSLKANQTPRLGTEPFRLASRATFPSQGRSFSVQSPQEHAGVTEAKRLKHASTPLRVSRQGTHRQVSDSSPPFRRRGAARKARRGGSLRLTTP